MTWPHYRPVVTVVDVLEEGACLPGVLSGIEALGGRIAGPTHRYLNYNELIRFAARADGRSGLPHHEYFGSELLDENIGWGEYGAVSYIQPGDGCGHGGFVPLAINQGYFVVFQDGDGRSHNPF